MKNFKKQQGVGMIEVLITFLLISIGVLGVSTMQRFTLKENMDTAQRSQAVWLFQDITERIRANNSPEAIQQYKSKVPSYIETPSDCDNTPTSCGLVSTTSNSTTTTSNKYCSNTELATYDAWNMACNAKNVILKSFSIDCYSSDNIKDANCASVDTLQLSLTWQRLTGKEDKLKAADEQTATFFLVP